jgi:hypothetical protein
VRREAPFARIPLCLLLVALPAPILAQKVKVGFDKSVDFAKYTSYSVVPPEVEPARPLLYLSVLGSIERELKSKGVVQKPKDGDLVLIIAGGIDVDVNLAAGTPYVPILGGQAPSVNSTMWTGVSAIPNAAAPYLPKGTLVLTFVDRRSNQVVWHGMVTGKFDMKKRNKAPQEVDRAITKLLSQFPPRKG